MEDPFDLFLPKKKSVAKIIKESHALSHEQKEQEQAQAVAPAQDPSPGIELAPKNEHKRRNSSTADNPPSKKRKAAKAKKVEYIVISSGSESDIESYSMPSNKNAREIQCIHEEEDEETDSIKVETNSINEFVFSMKLAPNATALLKANKRSIRFRKTFTLKPDEPIMSIINNLEKQQISGYEMRFRITGRPVLQSDTPRTLNLASKSQLLFVDYVLSSSESENGTSAPQNAPSTKINITLRGKANTQTVRIAKEQPVSVALREFITKFGLSNKTYISLDGDKFTLESSETLNDLDVEDNDLLDIVEL